MRPRRARWERGTAAVEFALLLPVLLLITGGIVDLGRLFYTQNIVVNAAREGARMRALGYDIGAWPPLVTDVSANNRVKQAMLGFAATDFPQPTYTLEQASGTTAGGNCPATPIATDRQKVVVRVPDFNYIVLGPASRLFGGALIPPDPTGVAEMRCGG